MYIIQIKYSILPSNQSCLANMCQNQCSSIKIIPFDDLTRSKTKILTQFSLLQGFLPWKPKFHDIKVLTTSKPPLKTLTATNIQAMKKAFHVAQQKKKILLCGFDKRFFLFVSLGTTGKVLKFCYLSWCCIKQTQR